MSVVVSPGSNLPLPVGVSEGQQFLNNHFLRFRSGVEADGLGGPIDFSHEIPNSSPRNVFDDVSDLYREFGLRRYRCYYLFNSHYTLAIPNIVAYIESTSVNPKSRISFSFGTSGFNGVEQVIPTQFHEPTGITWNSARERSHGSFLTEPLKPRNWKAFWVREILDFDADNTEFNFYGIKFETANPIAVVGAPDFAMTFVGNMGCGSMFQNILQRMINRNPSAIFTLGNNSYTNTANCWLDRISSVRHRVHMAFGAWDWYKTEHADKIDDSASPTIPKDWFWPEPEEGCDDNRYETEDGKDNQEVDPVVVSSSSVDEDDPKSPKIWKVEVFDKDEDEEGNTVLDREDIEEQWTFGTNETNARSYAGWLKNCKVTEGEVNKERFNLQLQNQYRNFFGINNFDGYQSFYANNIMFLILNTNGITRGHQEDSPQYRFAEEQLKRAVDNAFIDYRIVIAYRPGYVAPNDSMRTVLFEDGSVGLGGLGYQGPIRSFNDLYKPLFEKYKVTLYINGNVRNYQRTGILKYDSGNWIEPNEVSPTTGPDYKLKGRSLDSDGIIYVTVGTGGGSPLQQNQSLPSWIKRAFITNGYLHMTSLLNGQLLQFRFYDNNDTLRDFFSVGKEAFVFTPGTGGGQPSPAISMNIFGIKVFNPKVSGGPEWDSRLWNNGNPRSIIEDRQIAHEWFDPDDPFLCIPATGSAKLHIDGNGLATSEGGSPRVNVTKTWQNVESTVYFKPVHHGCDDFSIRAKTDHYCGEPDYAFGGYIATIDSNDKIVNVRKEETHEIGYTKRIASKVLQAYDRNKFLGFKSIVYQIPGTTHVKLEVYADLTEGFNGGDWQKITESIDDGSSDWTVGGVVYPPWIGTTGGSALRIDSLDEIGTAKWQVKWWHIREIIPPGTITPPSSSPFAGNDVFGIKNIYPSKSGGDSWASTAWNNGVDRDVLSDPGGEICVSDPYDSRLSFLSQEDRVLEIFGTGIAKFWMPGTTGEKFPRMRILGTWQNVEASVYVRIPASHPNISIDIRPKSDHYCNTIPYELDKFGGYVGYYRFGTNKDVYFRKEKTHNLGYVDNIAQIPYPNLVTEKWIGLKVVCYNIGSNVKVEAYIDDTSGANGGTWTKVTEFLDSGQIQGSPDTLSCIGSVFRANMFNDDGYVNIKWWSVREIQPPSTTTPPPTLPPPPTTGQILENGVKMFYPKKASANFGFSSGNSDRAQWVANLPHCFVNLEVTGYLKIDDVNDNDEEVSIKLRGGRHSDSDPSEGSCYIIGIGYDGSVNSQYEEPHPNNHSMSFTTVTSKPLGNNIVGKWFGIKAIVYKQPNANRDKIECWIDIGGLKNNQPANNWVKFWETTSNQFTGECNGDGNEKAYFRLDEIPGGDDEENVELRFASCREITVT